YKLYTFLIMDGTGIGSPVMHAFVEGEQLAPMRRLFGLFKEMMGEQYPVRTFVVDKLAAQMRAARVVFGCDVMLCHFYIRKAIRKHIHAVNSRHIFHRMARLDNAVQVYRITYTQIPEDMQLLRRTDPRFVFYLTARWLYIPRKWAVHAQSGMVHFGNVTNNRLENANGRLKDRVHHTDTLEHAIQKVFRHAEWLMREFEMHTSYHCDRRQIPEGDGYVLNVVCRMTTCACSLVLRHLGPRPPRLPYDSVGTNKPPPTAFDALRKQLNRVMDKLQGLKPRKATANFKQLIVHRQILLRQGPASVTDVLLSIVEDTAPQPRWRSRDTDLGFCVLCDRPTTTSDRWCATNCVSYHADCCDNELCPLCGDALQACPKGESTV
ncbi:hypothetical protein CLF_112695, partial [Clonorchis sinensis]